jgi:thiol-disulfide isomerase/thioredoxin
MAKFLVVLLLLGAIVGGAYLYNAQSAGPASPGSTPKAATSGSGPTVIDANQDPNFLARYKGKVVLIDFWATWCPPCKAAMPGVQKLHEEFSGRPVAVVGVNISEKSDPKAYMQSQGFTYDLVLNGETLARKYNVNGIPRFIVLGTDGQTVLLDETGFDPANDKKIAAAIEQELKSKGL